MGKIIAICNQKGGVGKTTTAINLPSALAMRGKNILVVDSDPQGNTTSGFGVSKAMLEESTYEVIRGDCSAKEAIVNLKDPKIDLLPSTINLCGAEIELLDMESREKRLKRALDEIREQYDYVFVDCPPSLSIVAINAFVASDALIIPLQCEYYALEGLALLTHSIQLVRKNYNSKLKVNGIIFTMFDGRTNLANEVVENVKRNIDEYIYETVIPRNVRLAEAPSYGQPIDIYAPTSTGAIAYNRMAEEFLEREGKR